MAMLAFLHPSLRRKEQIPQARANLSSNSRRMKVCGAAGSDRERGSEIYAIQSIFLPDKRVVIPALPSGVVPSAIASL